MPHADHGPYPMSGFDITPPVGRVGVPNVSNAGGDHARLLASALERPNILYIMADQMAAPLLKMHNPTSPIQTPNIDALAETGVVFNNAYCNSPLCAPSRHCMLTGQLPSKIGAYDNATALSSEVETFAHHLRAAGYETVLAGKMHFIGPDQLHGYEKRLTTDIYPGDFGWTVNWDDVEDRQSWYHNMASVLQAGTCVRSNQLDYDERVMFESQQYLYDYVRSGPTKRPFCLTVSLTHPHDPYTITKKYWKQYEGVDIPLPTVSILQDEQDPHSVRLMETVDLWDKPVPEEAVIRARRAYFGACSYVDDQLGKLLQVLQDCQLDQNTIIVFSGDHGDMLGERSMWYKMSWYEMSARVPLIVHYPRLFTPRRVEQVVSTLDLLPTFVDLAGGNSDELSDLDGRSLYGSLTGRSEPRDEVFGEYMGEGSISPVVMIRRGRYKYTTSLVDPPQLFDLMADPLELTNLAASMKPVYVEVVEAFAAEAKRKWDLERIHAQVLASQRSRRRVWKALNQGKVTPWDYVPPNDTAQNFIRSNATLDELELRARFPVVDAMGRESRHASHHGAAGAACE